MRNKEERKNKQKHEKSTQNHIVVPLQSVKEILLKYPWALAHRKAKRSFLKSLAFISDDNNYNQAKRTPP